MHTKNQHDEQGFTLLEVLVAVVIISFGLLGMAGMQAVGVKNTYNATLRTLAVQQAYDMADRMRSNKQGVTDGVYDALAATMPATIPSDPGCIATGCSASDLQKYDLRVWNSNNKAMLPSGSGGVELVAGTTSPNKEYIITVMWNENRVASPGTNCGVDITCVKVTFRP